MIKKSGQAENYRTEPRALEKAVVSEADSTGDRIQKTVTAVHAETKSTAPMTILKSVTKVTESMVKEREQKEKNEKKSRHYHRPPLSLYTKRNVEVAPTNGLPVVEDTVS
jgi:hypothetical protein